MKPSNPWLAWALACAACLLVFRDAFGCWFLMDDFAWLGLNQEVASAPAGDGWKLLLEPRAQGTVRVFSERLYFLILRGSFGIDPLPFRIAAFAAQFLNLWLIARIVGRLTASSAAAALAALFYAVSASAARPLAWASAFNQVLAACCMLAAFHYLLEWLETGSPRAWRTQFAIFLLSFGVLESAVAYPAIASLWTLLHDPRRLRATLPLWIPSLAFAAWHLFWIERAQSPSYAAVFGAGIFANLGIYAGMALGPGKPIVAWAVALLLLAGAARERGRKPAFFAFWFVAFLAPVLPFQNRIAEYYLMLPATGIALLIGCLPRPFAAAALAIFAVASVPEAQSQIDWLRTRSERIHHLFDAAAQLQRRKGVDTLLLSGIDSELFVTALQDSPFRLLGLSKVYLVPGSETSIRARAELGGVSAYRLSLQDAVRALESGSAAVLSITANEVFDATARYRGIAMSQYLRSGPRSVDVGAPGYEPLLGAGWWAIENNFRWMSKTASLTLGSSADARLRIAGFCPPSVASGGPVTLIVRADGVEIGRKTVSEAAAFTADFALGPPSGESVRIDLEVSRVTRLAGDKRDLGLIFGTFAVRP